MHDCCQDKASPYDIRPEEEKLIQAAIGLGEWLAAQPESTAPQRAAIVQMLAFLRNLPAPPPAGLHGEFGFEFVHNNLDIGHGGAWSVSVCRAMFEIFCCARDDLPEFSWVLCPGAVNKNDLITVEAWIAQVSNPRKLAIPEHSMAIEASTWAVAS